MFIKPKLAFYILLTAFFGPDAQSESEVSPGSIILNQLRSLDSVEAEDWGIRNGCIALHRIRAISFRDDQVAIINLHRRQQAVLKLKRECRGIAEQGFIIDARSDQLCVRFSRLTQAKSGISCEIEFIQPYVQLSDALSDTS